jgi:capsid protein
MDALAVSNRIPTDYFSNPIPYLRCQWLAPGTPPVDPLKEGRAEADAISNLLKSPQEVTAARGRDYEEVLDEIQAARQMQQDRELDVNGTSKSAKTNPASLMDEGVSP